MYAKVYQYKFPGISEAKVAAAFCSDYLGQKIDEHNFHGLSVLISQEGDLTILIKFDDVTKLKSFDKVADQFVEDLKNSFVFKENKYAINSSKLISADKTIEYYLDLFKKYPIKSIINYIECCIVSFFTFAI